MSDEQCKEHVFSGQRWDFGGHRCGNKAVKEGLCAIHTPEGKAAKKAKQEAKYAEREAANLKREIGFAVHLLRKHGYTVIEPEASHVAR